jgi:hypothetical protein
VGKAEEVVFLKPSSAGRLDQTRTLGRASAVVRGYVATPLLKCFEVTEQDQVRRGFV